MDVQLANGKTSKFGGVGSSKPVLLPVHIPKNPLEEAAEKMKKPGLFGRVTSGFFGKSRY
jgi:hypothetical protein